MGRRAETITISFLTKEDRIEFEEYAAKLGFGPTGYVRALHDAAKYYGDLKPDTGATKEFPRILRRLEDITAKHGGSGAGRKPEK